MKNIKDLAVTLWPLAVLAILTGCGTGKKIESSAIPSPAGQGTVPVKGASQKSTQYRVQPRDCLWAIAGKSGVYGDPFNWPLLYKANRDRIKDPDLIYPRQVLDVSSDPSSEDQAEAKRSAMATPRYVPHSKPRETLPVDYF